MSVASRAHAVTESLAVPPLTEERLRDIEISRRSPAGHSELPRGCDRGVRRRIGAHGAGRGHDPDARAQLWAPPTRARARPVERRRGWDPARRLFADDRSYDARGRTGGRARAARDRRPLGRGPRGPCAGDAWWQPLRDSGRRGPSWRPAGA